MSGHHVVLFYWGIWSLCDPRLSVREWAQSTDWRKKKKKHMLSMIYFIANVLAIYLLYVMWYIVVVNVSYRAASCRAVCVLKLSGVQAAEDSQGSYGKQLVCVMVSLTKTIHLTMLRHSGFKGVKCDFLKDLAQRLANLSFNIIYWSTCVVYFERDCQKCHNYAVIRISFMSTKCLWRRKVL